MSNALRKEIVYQEQCDLVKELEKENVQLRLELMRKSYAAERYWEDQKKLKQTVVIPNDAEGRAVVQYLRAHLCKGRKLRIYGRKPKNGWGRRASIPLSEAGALGLYFEHK
jgi:hypothetical protein